MRPLAGWMDNLLMRLKQLMDWQAHPDTNSNPNLNLHLNLNPNSNAMMDWQADLSMPKVAWLSGFFNPQSFLTAILQAQARKNEWPLDKVVVAVEVCAPALNLTLAYR